MRQAHLYACLRLFYQQKKEETILRKVMIQLGYSVSSRAFQIRQALTNRSGEGFVDTAIKILMAVVIGALVLAGYLLALWMLWANSSLPTPLSPMISMGESVAA